MKIRRNPFLATATLVALITSHSAHAASQTWDGSEANANWGTALNWVGGAAPGATSGTINTDVATFDAAIANTWGLVGSPILIDSTTQNIGGISFDTLAGNYFIGTTAGNSLLLTSGGTIQILNTLSATNAIQTINAPLVIQDAAGTYSFANNSANGSGAGAGTLNFAGGITGGAAGATVLTLSGSNTNSNTISGIIANGTATTMAVTKTGAGTWTLGGVNTYTGATAINQGTLILTGGRAGAITGALTMGSGVIGTQTAASVGNLTINTADVTVGAITVKSNTSDTTTAGNIGLLSIAAGRTLTASSFTAGLVTTDNTNATFTSLGTGSTPGAGGTLTVNGNMAIGQGTTADARATSTTAVNLSGLDTLNVTSTGAGYLRVGFGRKDVGTLVLANTANTLNVGTLSVGDSVTGQPASLNTLSLGAGTNALQAPTINIGAGKAAGKIEFAGANGSVVITGANGTGTATIVMGNASSNTYGGGTNSLLLAGHTATVEADSVVLSRKAVGSGGGNVTSNVTFDTGTFTASTILMAGATSGSAGSGVVTGTFTVGGATANSAATGVVNIGGNLLLANLLSGTATGVGTLTINGGTVNVNTAAAATNGIFDTSVAGASTTTLNLQGGTLNLNGGVIGGTTGTGKRDITNYFKSGTLQNVLQINGGAGLTKITDGTGGGGTLTLSGTNSFTGGLTINAGTVQLGSAGALLTTAGSENAVTFGASSTGTLALIGRNTVVASLNTNATPGTTFVQNANGSSVANATLTVGNSTNAASSYAGTIQNGSGGGTLALTKAGSNTLTLSGNNTYTGATTVSGGTLAVNGSISSSATTVETTGVLTGTGTLGSSLTVKSTGVVNAGTVGSINTTASVTGATSFESGSIFSWDLSADGMTADKLTTASVTGSGAIFRILLGDGTVNNSFFNTNQTNFFADTNIISSVSDLTTLFSSVQVYSGVTNTAVNVSARGSFSLTSAGVSWTAVPEPTSALAGLLLGAGLLRRRRSA